MIIKFQKHKKSNKNFREKIDKKIFADIIFNVNFLV